MPCEEEIIEISSHFSGRIHVGIQFEVVSRKCKMAGKRRLLDGTGQFQFLLDPFFRRGDITFQYCYGLVDIVGQGGKLGRIPYIHDFIQIPVGDLLQGMIDQLQIVDDDQLHQHGNQDIDHRKQQDICQCGLISLDIPVCIDFLDGEPHQQRILFGQFFDQTQSIDIKYGRLKESIFFPALELFPVFFHQDRDTVLSYRYIAGISYDVIGAAHPDMITGKNLVQFGKIQLFHQVPSGDHDLHKPIPASGHCRGTQIRYNGACGFCRSVQDLGEQGKIHRRRTGRR